MKNQDLIKKLQEYPPDMEITIAVGDWAFTDYHSAIKIEEEKDVIIQHEDGCIVRGDTLALS